MRVAFLAPEFYPPIGGVGTYSLLLAKALSRMRGIDLHVFTPRRGANYDPEKVLDFFDNKINLHNISDARDTFAYNFYFQKAIGAEFYKYNSKYNYDLIHSANLVHMPDIFLKFRKQTIPSVVTGHTTIKGQVAGFLKGNKNFFRMASSEKSSIILYPLIASLEAYYLKKTPNLITPSETFKKVFEKRGYKGKIFVVRHGIDTNIYSYKKANDAAGRFISIKNIKDPIVLYAGRLISQKGVGLFVAMMDRLIKKGVRVHFVIAGHGDDKILKILLETYKIPKERYTFLGFINNHELPWLYKKSSVFVLPSFYENFPISLMEAMAMRCVCVATNVVAVSELIEDEKDGFVVPAGDFEAICKRVEQLLGNGKLRKSFGLKAEQKIRKNFSALQMEKNTRKVYEKILDTK